MAQLRFNDENYYADNANIGYYQYVNMTDMLNDFMITKVGPGKLINKVDRHDVEWLMQRAVQEFSYDVLRPISTWEEALTENGLSVRVPQNMVELLNVSFVDLNGYSHAISPQRFLKNAKDPLVDSDGEYTYDNDGELTFPRESESITNWQASNRGTDVAREFYNYYAGSFENDELYDRYYSYYGRRYGSEPEVTQLNGTYVYDEEIGVIFFSGELLGSKITYDYISDGLDVNKDLIKVHKFAEEAIYDYVIWKSIGHLRDMPLYEKQLAEKNYRASKRRAKIRLAKINPSELFNIMKNKAKWVKH